LKFRGNDSVDSKRKSTKTPFLRAHCGKLKFGPKFSDSKFIPLMRMFQMQQLLLASND
jgi:hypothetical protein